MMNHRAKLSGCLGHTLHRMWQDKPLYAMLLPALIYFGIFRVWPILNMRLAFFDYKARGPWVFAGLKYFQTIFQSSAFNQILQNTLIISFMKYVLLFPAFVIFALPVLHPCSALHSASSSGPAAAWMAPSTPLPPSREVLAALTMASA